MRCTTCVGTGQIELPVELRDALNYVRNAKRATACGLWYITVKEKIGRAAANQRLERLRHAGLVTRKMQGREWIYSIAE